MIAPTPTTENSLSALRQEIADENKTQTTALARKLARGNPGIRVAVSSTGSGIAIFHDGKWQAVIERTLLGTYVHGGVNHPERQWEEVQ